MKKNVTYGECLAEILKALDVKCSRLAREINIDSSLIYKWLRNERVPPYDSLYIDLILNFLSKKLIYPFQKKSVIEILSNYGIALSDASDETIINSLRRILENSQANSIKLHKKIKNEHKLKATTTAGTAGLTGRPGLTGNEKIFCGFDNVQIVKGSLEVIHSAADLLTRTPKAPPVNEKTILITFNNDLRLQLFTREIYRTCIKTLHDLLSNGWKCILHTMFDGNTDRTIKIIEGILSLLTTGNLSVYYYPRQLYEHEKETELCIIPQNGALLSFPTQTNDQIDSAFLFRSNSSIEILSSRFFKNLDSAKPLLKPFPSQKSVEFQHAFADNEEAPGEKYVFKGGLSTLTLPLDLYEKYLKLNGIANQELSHRKYLHKRRIDAFKEHVKHYKFRDICFVESVVDLVENRKYSYDEKYIIRNHTPQNSDIAYQLEYLAGLLETYDNYNVAFVSKKHFLHMNNINWMVKSNSCVLIESGLNIGTDYLDSDKNFLISEKSVVNAFHDYFNILWDSIPDENKDKKNSIDWLRSLIKKYDE